MIFAGNPYISSGYGADPARDIDIGVSVFVHSESPDRAKILGNPRSRVARDTAKALSTNSSNSARIFEWLQAEAGA
jgi:hypothetical protein